MTAHNCLQFVARQRPASPREGRWHVHGAGRSAFTLTEMLVVIGIIALLAGILLVALGKARTSALDLKSKTIMQSFARACDAFQQDHGFYPGIIPEKALENDDRFTAMESALLHLMGGAVRDDPLDADDMYDQLSGEPGWQSVTVDPGGEDIDLLINFDRIGDGPIINGKPYAPYFSPDGDELRVVEGQSNAWDPPSGASGRGLPDLVDAWGQPIIYLRRLRDAGPLVGSAANPGSNPGGRPPQYAWAGFDGYIDSNSLGELGKNQNQSLLRANNDDQDLQRATLAQLIRHPAMGEFAGIDNALNGTARGAYSLFSAGPDGIYFAIQDGPGTSETPVRDIVTTPAPDGSANAQVLDEYDDIRVFGGG